MERQLARWRGLRVTLALLPLLLATQILAIQTPEAHAAEPWSGQVTTDALNVRSAPNTDAPIQDVLTWGTPVQVVATVTGEAVGGSSTWYRLASGGYVYGPYVAPASGQGSTRTTGSATAGRWIDVDLTNLTVTAYEGNAAVYVAPVTTGRAGLETPTGTFTIWRRVYNETMDSTTLGIPRNSPEGYYLTDVFFTQYFTYDGAALHYNWWADPSVFGRRNISRGCVGLDWDDAAFFWDFADVGTPVVIHY